MYEYAARLVRVVDADTLRVDIDLGFDCWLANQSIRLRGVNAPELATLEGKAARDYAKGWLGEPGVMLFLRTARDRHEKYGRWLATVWPADGDHGDEASINAALLRSGYAVPFMT